MADLCQRYSFSFTYMYYSFSSFICILGILRWVCYPILPLASVYGIRVTGLSALLCFMMRKIWYLGLYQVLTNNDFNVDFRILINTKLLLFQLIVDNVREQLNVIKLDNDKFMSSALNCFISSFWGQTFDRKAYNLTAKGALTNRRRASWPERKQLTRAWKGGGRGIRLQYGSFDLVTAGWYMSSSNVLPYLTKTVFNV